MDLEEFDGLESDSDDSDGSEINAQSLIKEWRHASTAKLSPFFHTPKLVGERNFRAANDSGSDERKKKLRILSIWVRLILYCLFLYFFISSVQMRRRVPVTNDVIDSIRSMVKSNFHFRTRTIKRRITRLTTFTRSTKCGNGSKVHFQLNLPNLHYTSSTIVVGGRLFVLKTNKLMMGGVRMRQYRSGNKKINEWMH